MKVLVKETMACWVDFYHEVEVDDCEDRAIDALRNGEAEYIGCEVLRNLDYCESEVEIVDSLPCTVERG